MSFLPFGDFKPIRFGQFQTIALRMPTSKSKEVPVGARFHPRIAGACAGKMFALTESILRRFLAILDRSGNEVLPNALRIFHAEDIGKARHTTFAP